jgi:hypothetical protein
MTAANLFASGSESSDVRFGRERPPTVTANFSWTSGETSVRPASVRLRSFLANAAAICGEIVVRYSRYCVDVTACCSCVGFPADSGTSADSGFPFTLSTQ